MKSNAALITFTFELLKILFQFLSTLMIAWLTVRWALKRNKSEKIWERTIIAHSDTIECLHKLERACRTLESHHSSHELMSEYNYNLVINYYRKQIEKLKLKRSIGFVFFSDALIDSISTIIDTNDLKSTMDKEYFSRISQYISIALRCAFKEVTALKR